MKLILQLSSLFAMYVLLASATYIKKSDTAVVNAETVTIAAATIFNVVKKHRLSFFQRLMIKVITKTRKLFSTEKADRLASTSVLLGLGACALLLLGLFVPYLLLGTIPAGAAALITGASALRNKTTMTGRAKTGKALGLAALVAFGVIVILVAIAIAGAGFN